MTLSPLWWCRHSALLLATSTMVCASATAPVSWVRLKPALSERFTRAATAPIEVAPPISPSRNRSSNNIITVEPAFCYVAQTCLDHEGCAACIVAINSSSNSGDSPAVAKIAQKRFFSALTSTPACAPTNTPEELLTGFMKDITVPLCARKLNVQVEYCQTTEYTCFVDQHCRQCLSLLYNDRISTSAALATNECRNASSAGLLPVACNAFPSCSYSKQQCSNQTTCNTCLQMLQRGDGVGAAESCTTETVAVTMNDVADYCLGKSPVGCDFFRTRCLRNKACRQCLDAMDGGASVGSILSGASHPACSALRVNANSVADEEALSLLAAYFSICPLTTFTPCQSAVAACTMLTEGCILCLNGTSNSTECTAMLDDPGFSVNNACATCPKIVGIINTIVVATSVVGGVSVIVCVGVILIIFSRGKGAAFRDHVVAGLMAANALYSAANCIPINLLQTSIAQCGQLVLSLELIRIGRGIWFLGKFGIAFFEIVILLVSLIVLAYGARAISRRHELLMVGMCILGGAGAFIAFYLSTASVEQHGFNATTQFQSHADTYTYTNTIDDLDDDTPAIAASEKFDEARSEYDALLQRMLQVWLGVLGLAVVLWIALRVSFVRRMQEWNISLAEAENQWDRDLWAPSHQRQRKNSRRLLHLVKEGYEEIAKPLELYVIVFLLYGCPAALMATDYCQLRSSARSTATSMYVNNNATVYGTCDVWCEFALSLRSLSSVLVFFCRMENRDTLPGAATICRRLLRKLCGLNVTVNRAEKRISVSSKKKRLSFAEAVPDEVRLLPRGSEEAGYDDEETFSLDTRSTSSAEYE